MLILICGVPGSGKSTSAQYWKNTGAIVLSSDALRAQLGSGEGDQSVSPLVFRLMEQMAEYLLRHDYRVLIDATNYNIKARKPFVDLARKYNRKILAEVISVSLVVAKERNKARARVVPDDVIERMFNQFEMPTKGEVDEVKIILA